MNLLCEETHVSVKLGMLKLTSSILEEIREGQEIDLGLMDCWVLINQGEGGELKIDENSVMRFRYQVYDSGGPDLKKSILEEGYLSGLSIHPSATKMYQDMKNLFWWPSMKKEVVELVYSSLIYHKSYIKH